MNSIDEIFELYKRDVDVTLIDEGLKRTVDDRMQALEAMTEKCRKWREGPNMTRLAEILRLLVATDIEFVVVAGVAAVAHGSPRPILPSGSTARAWNQY